MRFLGLTALNDMVVAVHSRVMQPSTNTEDESAAVVAHLVGANNGFKRLLLYRFAWTQSL